MSVIFDNLGSPWAGIGKKVDSAVSVADAMEKAGLDWTVSKEPMFVLTTNLYWAMLRLSGHLTKTLMRLVGLNHL